LAARAYSVMCAMYYVIMFFRRSISFISNTNKTAYEIQYDIHRNSIPMSMTIQVFKRLLFLAICINTVYVIAHLNYVDMFNFSVNIFRYWDRYV